MKLLASLVLAALFLGIFFQVKGEFEANKKTSKFKERTEKIASYAEQLAYKTPGEQRPFQLTVPDGCEMKIAENRIEIVTNKVHTYNIDIGLEGPTLDPGSYHLIIKRTENLVVIEVE